MSEDVPEQYRPRLSHVVKWEDFQGYGFNLHAEKGKAGQFIGKVDAHSPAEAAGLKEGDRIVEVNGVNIGNENHQQVVTRIKSGGEETRLLVVDTESDDWYKDNKKIVRGDLPEVRIISSKRDNDDEVTGQGQDDDRDEHREDSHHESDVEDIVGSGSSAVVHNGNRHVNEDDSYRPRLCHLKLWQHFQGYGFNLHAERDKPGQYIGLVDDNSPASTAGLKVHDRIIEVNGVNIEKEKHSDVIGRIKAIPGETKLLVVDKRVDDYYREKGVSITSSLPQTDYTITPDAADLAQVKETATLDTNSNTASVFEIVELDRNQGDFEKILTKEDDEEAEVEEKKENVENEKVDQQFTVISLPIEKKNNDDKSEDLAQVKETATLDTNTASVFEIVELDRNQGDFEKILTKEDDEEAEVEEKKENVENEKVDQQLTVISLPIEKKNNDDKSEDVVNGLKSSVHVQPSASEPEHEFTVAQHVHQEKAAASSAPVSKEAEGLELHLSVAEMKERLKSKKRQDPRMNKVSFEQKYKEFQRM